MADTHQSAPSVSPEAERIGQTGQTAGSSHVELKSTETGPQADAPALTVGQEVVNQVVEAARQAARTIVEELIAEANLAKQTDSEVIASLQREISRLADDLKLLQQEAISECKSQKDSVEEATSSAEAQKEHGQKQSDQSQTNEGVSSSQQTQQASNGDSVLVDRIGQLEASIGKLETALSALQKNVSGFPELAKIAALHQESNTGKEKEPKEAQHLQQAEQAEQTGAETKPGKAYHSEVAGRIEHQALVPQARQWGDLMAVLAANL